MLFLKVVYTIIVSFYADIEVNTYVIFSRLFTHQSLKDPEHI